MAKPPTRSCVWTNSSRKSRRTNHIQHKSWARTSWVIMYPNPEEKLKLDVRLHSDLNLEKKSSQRLCSPPHYVNASFGSALITKKYRKQLETPRFGTRVYDLNAERRLNCMAHSEKVFAKLKHIELTEFAQFLRLRTWLSPAPQECSTSHCAMASLSTSLWHWKTPGTHSIAEMDHTCVAAIRITIHARFPEPQDPPGSTYWSWITSLP